MELKGKFGDETIPFNQIVSNSMKGVSRTLLDLQINEQCEKITVKE